MISVDYINSCDDAYDETWANEYFELKRCKEWTGTITVTEITDKHIIAKADSRGSEFTIVLDCYFYMSPVMSEWCVCVPNWEFGGKISLLEKYNIFCLCSKYISNKVDCISCTNAIWTLLENARNNYYEEAKKAFDK